MNKLVKVLGVLSTIIGVSVVIIFGSKINSKAMVTENNSSVNLKQIVEKQDRKKQSKEEKIILEKTKEFVNYFCNQEFKKAEDMFVDNIYNTTFFEEYYNIYFKGNDYIDCKDVIYYGYDKKKKAYACMVKIHGKYRTDLVTLNFNRYYKLTVFYHHYSIPEPEENEYFKEERVVVGDEYKLEGLLTLPKNNEKAPVVILVHGSGYNNADESYGPNRIFAEIAHSLAKQGIATLRYNERYFQHDSLADGSETVYTEAIDDACIAVKQMVKDNRVNNDKIFIAGHSLGGMVAPKIAELCSEVSGIISLAGSPRKLIDIGREQIVQQLMESTEYKNEEDRNKDIEEVKTICDMIENLSEDSNEKILNYSHTYWRSVNNLDVKSSIEKLSIPMLILQGKDDFQVYADKDYIEWQRLLNKRNNCHFKLYDGLNHFFIPTQGAGWNDFDKEYGTPNHVDKRVLNDMSGFINMYSK